MAEAFEPHDPNCAPECISGPQLRAALEMLGLWFDGYVLDVKIGGRDGVQMTGHNSSWYAEARVGVVSKSPSCQPRLSSVYEERIIRVPVHVGPTMMQRWKEEVERNG